jgi:hypothetical protein
MEGNNVLASSSTSNNITIQNDFSDNYTLFPIEQNCSFIAISRSLYMKIFWTSGGICYMNNQLYDLIMKLLQL